MKKTETSPMLDPEQTKLTWYRVGMVWLMVGLPALVVVASIITVVIAHDNAPLLIPTPVETPAKP